MTLNSKRCFILKGNIAYSQNKDEIATFEDSYVICVDGISKGVYSTIPEEYKSFEVIDYSGKLIIPGMVDLHTHAPQNTFRGMYMDLELMDWLNQHTFVSEAKYEDVSFARDNYKIFVDNMKNGATTRAVVFATIHENGTKVLMDMLEETGLNCYVGLVNMDRNAPDNLVQKGVDKTIDITEKWINSSIAGYKNIKPILTPRFIPACSEELLEKLGDLCEKYNIPVQSHLSENPGEVEFVKELMPSSKFYGDAYSKFGLFGEHGKCVMAHCVYSGEEEVKLMKENGVFVAHCPSSNLNLSSGIAPAKKYLAMGLNIGLGTDIAGGDSDSIFNEIKTAIQVSKMYWRYIDSSYNGLTFEEAFFMATLGGGSFFGKCGSFNDGYEFDAIVIDDKVNDYNGYLSIRDRLERCIYMSADRNGIVAKYVLGTVLLSRGASHCHEECPIVTRSVPLS